MGWSVSSFYDMSFQRIRRRHHISSARPLIASGHMDGGESVNVFEGPLEERMMTTGVHTVADIYCKGCQQNVGWKYEFAQHKAQKYKEGKFILERGRIVGCEKGDFYLETQAIGSDPDDVPLE
ncbi:protein yippee-like At5g53940 isoform X4 [Selaginella moellendorffii]|uniref:protein yippee-like At5g53940 isoform X4 n=1 Tax=Selaginella moellendorffii TaxID=88036 RepID=UPI000D1C4B98|nr:protein yippee-like At5g53940 isoform X4 [Selaginella moellendorffii]|eukprot:XP_024545141.1 protein yippee-like At5g53940 isoform X4 [Selaginella moellendorffii]